ncbi:MAG: N(G),N(G)-dimethylarginine dimethylaminohydrolase [Caryophanon sp.]|nr:N(G),N(G)-dimethylarginine dimethylaminohydrolase [Caryophanon sp.]
MIQKVIVRKPGESFSEGLTTSGLDAPDYITALAQHEQYVQAIRDCGLQVIELHANELYPDSTFVEDVAITTSRFAVLANPAPTIRSHEAKLIEPVIREHFDKIYRIFEPGKLEGGDILKIENRFFVGLTERTNAEGAAQFKHVVEHNGYECEIVEVEHAAFLKQSVTYIGKNTILVCGEFVDHPLFATYDQIVVPQEEAYATNALKINEHLFIPSGYPQTAALLEKAGFTYATLHMSEFQKQDGALTCLSLRF